MPNLSRRGSHTIGAVVAMGRDFGVAVRVRARVAGIVVRLACTRVVTDGDGAKVVENVGEGMTIVAVAVASSV